MNIHGESKDDKMASLWVKNVIPAHYLSAEDAMLACGE